MPYNNDWLRDAIGNAAFDALKDELIAASPPREETLVEKMERSTAKLREIQRRRPGAKRRNHNLHLRKMAIDIGEIDDGVEYWIAPNGMAEECARMRQREKEGRLPAGFCEKHSFLMNMENALNGYVAFDKRKSPLQIRGRGMSEGILAYIPVHGGITYANKDQTACVFGFDTAHYNSEHVPRSDKNWIKWQCRVLYEGLLLAGKIEKEYLKAKGNNPRCAELLQPLVDLIPEEELGFGAMINLLSGEL